MYEYLLVVFLPDVAAASSSSSVKFCLHLVAEQRSTTWPGDLRPAVCSTLNSSTGVSVALSWALVCFRLSSLGFWLFPWFTVQWCWLVVLFCTEIEATCSWCACYSRTLLSHMEGCSAIWILKREQETLREQSGLNPLKHTNSCWWSTNLLHYRTTKIWVFFLSIGFKSSLWEHLDLEQLCFIWRLFKNSITRPLNCFPSQRVISAVQIRQCDAVRDKVHLLRTTQENLSFKDYITSCETVKQPADRFIITLSCLASS